MRALAVDNDAGGRAAVAQNPATPAAILVHLVDDPDFCVRAPIGHHALCDEQVQPAICRTGDADLWRQLTNRADLSAGVTKLLAADADTEAHRELAAETHDAGTLAADPNARVRAGAALNPRTISDQCRTLAADRSAVVRSTLVRGVPLDEADLQRLAGDRSVEVRWWLASRRLGPRPGQRTSYVSTCHDTT